MRPPLVPWCGAQQVGDDIGTTHRDHEIAERHDLAEDRNGDDVGEHLEAVGRLFDVPLDLVDDERAASADEPCGANGRLPHRHTAIHDDDKPVERDPDQHDAHSGVHEVEATEHDEEHVRDREEGMRQRHALEFHDPLERDRGGKSGK